MEGAAARRASIGCSAPRDRWVGADAPIWGAHIRIPQGARSRIMAHARVLPMFAYEKRRGARHRRCYSVVLGPYSSLTVDVSSAGFCAQSARSLPRGADVEGAMKVGGRWVPFGGRVAWSAPGRDSGCARVGAKIGVRFTRVPWDLQRLLER